MFNAVERGYFLTSLRRAGEDARHFAIGALDQHIVIEGMQRLPGFEHDIIGHIHDVIDRAFANGKQPPLHPLWRRLDLYIFDQHGRETGIEFSVANGQAKLSLERWSGSLNLVRWFTQCLACERRHFARHPDNAIGTGNVWRQFNIKDHVAQDVHQRRTGLCSDVLKQQYPVVVVAQAEFFAAAHHRAVGDATQRLFLQNHPLLAFSVSVVNFRAFERQRRVKRWIKRSLVLIGHQVRRTRYHLFNLRRPIIDHR